MTADHVKQWSLAFAWLLGVTALILGVEQFTPWSLKWNLSGSIPRGLYLGHAYQGERLTDGQLACFPYHAPAWAQSRNYFPDAFPLCKHVAAQASDTVVVDHGQVALVRGDATVSLGTLRTQDSAGRSIPNLLPASQLLVAADLWMSSLYNEKSFDSRYLGLINKQALLYTLTPLITE